MCCQETKWTLHGGIRQCTTQHTLSTETNSCSIRSNSLKRKNCLRQVWEGKKTAARMSNIEEMPHGYHHDTVNTIIRSNKLQERPGDERIYMLYDIVSGQINSKRGLVMNAFTCYMIFYGITPYILTATIRCVQWKVISVYFLLI